jgi:hypothetical protein
MQKILLYHAIHYLHLTMLIVLGGLFMTFRPKNDPEKRQPKFKPALAE